MPVSRKNRVSPSASAVESNTFSSDVRVSTLFDVIYSGLNVNRDAQCIGEKDHTTKYLTYDWITYGQLINESQYLAKGLIQLGLSHGQETMIGIYTNNSIQWVVSLFALFHESMVAIPIYDRINESDYTYIVNETQIECLLTDTSVRTHQVISKLSLTPKVKIIIAKDKPSHHDIKIASDKKCQIYSLRQVINLGKNIFLSDETFHPPQSNFVAEICFTPGTTGKPKGVVLTHGNFAASFLQIKSSLSKLMNIERETLLSFVPLIHPFSLIGFFAVYACGGKTAMFSGEVRSLIADMQLVHPTILFVIPRFLDNIYNRIIYSVKGRQMQTKLMEYALRWGEGTSFYGSRSGKLLQSMVFGSQRKRILGGQIRLIVSGCGPLSPNVLQFLRTALGATILDSYGLTETAGFATLTPTGNLHSVHSGSPLTCTEIKLIDLPELGHYVEKTGIGEICVRGSNVSTKVYPEATVQLKEPQQQQQQQLHQMWLKTGDIGTWTPNGSLRVIERKENIVKLQGGVFIAPERVEGVYNQSAFVSECFVDSDPSNKFLLAIIVPEVDYLNDWCVSNHIFLNTEQACSDFLFKHHVMKDMIRTGDREGLRSFEQVRNIHLHPKPFTVQNGLLTPNYATRRAFCKIFFNQIIAELALQVERIETSSK